MTRAPKVEYFLAMARLTSTQGTCARRKVGCILVNSRNHVIATGYNGPPSGHVHCIDRPCPGANQPSGEGLELCQAIHAEQNALLQCRNVYEIETAYCTTAPCVHCVKLLLNTSCQHIVFSETYPHARLSEQLWRESNRGWLHLGA